jgi:hypothetical protein
VEEVAVYILYIHTTLGVNYDVIYLHFLVVESQNLSATPASFLIRTLRLNNVAFLVAYWWRRGDRNF